MTTYQYIDPHAINALEHTLHAQVLFMVMFVFIVILGVWVWRLRKQLKTLTWTVKFINRSK
jgi:hypothetical protein